MSPTVAALRLPIDDWPCVIGVLWSTAQLHPEQLETVGRLGSQLYAEYARALGLDAEQVADWLVGLPPVIRQQVRDSAGHPGGQGPESGRG